MSDDADFSITPKDSLKDIGPTQPNLVKQGV
jgi:hypothetical protein